MRRTLLAIGVAVLSACGGGDSGTTPTATSERLEQRFQTDHFRIVAGTASEAALRAAADRLEAEYPRILADLSLASLPPITVRIWQDESTYFSEMTRYFGVRYSASGYITGPTELRALATAGLSTTIVHEFVHAASMAVNPQIPNNPRWFWETVALFENGELVNPRTLDYVVRGNFPTLQQLNADPNAGAQIYQLGYVLGEFIVSRYGRPSFLRLIQTNADLRGVLGVSAAEFETAWQSYVRQRYLS